MNGYVDRWVVRSRKTGLYWLGYLKPSRWVKGLEHARLYENAPGQRWDSAQIEIIPVRVIIEVAGGSRQRRQRG